MKNIRRRIGVVTAVVTVLLPLLVTVYLLFWSSNDLSARQTAKQRTFGATYMTMNNPYFQILDAQIQALLQINGDVLITRDAASAGIFAYEATFRGPGGHVCHSRHLENPVHMACKAVAQIAELPEPGPETVNAVTVMQGGMRNNIVPTECTVAGSVRAFDETLHNTMRRQVMDILQSCGDPEITTTIDVMGTRIDPGMLAIFCRTANALYPERGWQALKKRDMIGEDFARFAAKVPGIYFFLHTRPENGGYPLHHPKFDVNESVLHKGSELFAAFALSWQNEAQ